MGPNPKTIQRGLEFHKMSQKSITSSSTSSSDGQSVANPVAKNKEESAVKLKVETKPEVQNSPLKEPNRIVEDEESIDSPIKKTTKVKTSGARRRIESSSEEENGSPVKESPPKVKVKAAASKGKKRKSSPSSSEKTKSTKKAKEEDEEKLELESELEGLKEEAADLEIPTQSRSNKRRSQQEKDALPKKSKSVTKNEAKNDETIEAEKAKTTEGK